MREDNGDKVIQHAPEEEEEEESVMGQGDQEAARPLIPDKSTSLQVQYLLICKYSHLQLEQ